MEIQISPGEQYAHLPNITPSDLVDIVTLPPPPEPFPLDLIDGRNNGALTESTLRQNLADVQSSCVQALSSILPDDSSLDVESLPEEDRQLAGALVELLEVTYELERPPPAGAPDANPTDANLFVSTRTNLEDSYAVLTRHLGELQAAAPHQDQSAVTALSSSRLRPAVNTVREDLAWARVDSLTHAIGALIQIRSRRAAFDPFATQEDLQDPLLPRYSRDERRISVDQCSLPSYHDDGFDSMVEKKEKDPGPEAPRTTMDEKMKIDFDAVTSAISRLHSVAPRMMNQRSEPRPFPDSPVERDQKEKELEEIWDRIERAHGKRRAVEQRAHRDGWRERRSLQREKFLVNLVNRSESSRLDNQDSDAGPVNPDLAHARELRARDHFLRDLVTSNEDGRLSDQDVAEPDEAVRLQKQRTFISDIIARSQAGRMRGQDFPISLEDKLAEKKEILLDNILDLSSSRRYQDQDSLPPTPRTTVNDPFELVTVQDFLSAGPRRGSSASVSDDNGHLSSTKSMSRSRSDSLALSENGDTKKIPTAFRKVAGFVRRRSSFGLKLPGTDLASIAYVAEHQENLRIVHLILHGTGLSPNSELALEISKSNNSEALLVSKASSFKIALPAAVVPGQICTLEQQDLLLEAKLSAFPTPVATQTLLTSHTLSAPYLRRVAPIGLCCTVCDREIADLSLASAVSDGFKDLPSEHWAEMMEVWMCHSDPGFTAQLAQTTKDGFWPDKGRVLVGESYLLLHSGDVKSSNLVLDPFPSRPISCLPCLGNKLSLFAVREPWKLLLGLHLLPLVPFVAEASESSSELTLDDVQFDIWQVVTCICGEVLGKMKRSDGKSGSGTMRFSKWAIALLKDDECVEPVRYPLSVFVVADMLELAQAHATYRFVIVDEETNQRRLLVWLFNPSVGIAYRKATGSPLPSPLRTSFMDQRLNSNPVGLTSGLNASTAVSDLTRSLLPPSKTLRAAKIMYKVITEDGVNVLESNLPGFGVGGQFEQLLYSGKVCGRLIAVLKDSTSVYPASKRTMSGFEVGFLERF